LNIDVPFLSQAEYLSDAGAIIWSFRSGRDELSGQDFAPMREWRVSE
jgi:hypothetical protein